MNFSRESRDHFKIALFVLLITMSLAFAVSCAGPKKKVEIHYYPADTYEVVEVIDPCGPEGDHDEVLLRINNNVIVTEYSRGNKNYFVTKPPGQYITNDGTKCTYRIAEDYTVNW